MSRSLNRWLWSLILLLPVIVLYVAEYQSGDGTAFTGFIQYDQPLYMANARSFFDGHFHLFYNNPFSADPGTPRIYFQPHLFLLGAILALTGCDPGTLYVIFGFIAALICVRVAIALYEEIAGLDRKSSWLGLILFLWGGGVFTIAGAVYHRLSGNPPQDYTSDLFHFDPFGGWWFLNLGRNLIFPTEAYYHAVALGTILLAIRSRFLGALILAGLISMSHPFTGVQFLLILLAWCWIERFFVKSRIVPNWFFGGLAVLLAWHLFYYMVFLNQFPEQLAISQHYALAWVARASAFIPADLLVGLMAAWAMRTLPFAQELFSSPVNRLLLAWFGVSFALGHHDFAFDPMQPIHFLRGYTWMPLFLLGVQPLLRLFDWAERLESVVLRALVVSSVMFIGLLDNVTWMGFYIQKAFLAGRGQVVQPDGFRLKATDRELHAWLKQRPGPHEELLLTADPESPLVYMGIVYAGYRGWYGHSANAPFALKRRQEVLDFFRDGTAPQEWKGRTLFLITDKHAPPAGHEFDVPVIYENEDYRVQEMVVR